MDSVLGRCVGTGSSLLSGGEGGRFSLRRSTWTLLFLDNCVVGEGRGSGEVDLHFGVCTESS